MGLALWDSEYKEITRLHDLSMRSFFEENHSETYDYAVEALDKLSRKRKWPRMARYSKNILHGNLLCFRSQSLEALKPNDPSLFSILTHDYKQAIGLLREEPNGVRMLFMAMSTLVDLLIEKSLREEVSYFEEAYSYLTNMKAIAEKVSSEMFLDKAGVISRMASCHGMYVHGNSLYDLDKAIRFLEESNEFYETKSHTENQIKARISLAKFYYQRSQNNTDRQDIEKAILHQEKVMQLICGTGPRERPVPESASLHLAFLGHLYLYRNKDWVHDSIQTAFQLLNTASGMIDDKKYPIDWVDCVLDLIDAVFRMQEPTVVRPDIDGLMQTVDEHFQRIFEILEEGFYPREMFRALMVRGNILSAFGGYQKEDALKELKRLSEQIQGIEKYNDLYIEVQIAYSNEAYGSIKNDELIEFYETASNQIDIKKSPTNSFDIFLRLGKCYQIDNQQGKAILNYRKALELLISFKKTRDINNLGRIKKRVHSSDLFILNIPCALLETDGAIDALRSLEHLRFHPVTPLLEELYVLEHQVNRMHWITQRNLTRMAEITLHGSGKKGDKFETDEEFNEFQKRYDYRLQERIVNLAKIDNYYKKVAELKEEHPLLTEDYFLSNLNDFLPRIESWVLIPLPNDSNMRHILIPPHAKESDIFVSDPIHSSYIEALSELVGENREGWLPMIHQYQSPPYCNDMELIDSVFDRMQTYLWNDFAGWICSVLETLPVKSPIELTIIPYGSFSLFPFCMAKNPDNGEYWMDRVNISYAPSLYACYTLQERRKLYKEKPRLGYMSHPVPNVDDPSFKNYPNMYAVPIERELCCSIFEDAPNGSAIARGMDGSDIFEASQNASYWHFTAHGKADLMSYTKSVLKDYDDKQLLPELLAAFGTNYVLRLVVLSACEAGVSEMLGKELSPESYLTELLKCGAIGAIGVLWQIPETPAAILMGRFYHYHIQENEKPASALRLAQIWLRTVTVKELHQLIKELSFDDPKDRRAVEFTLERLGIEDSDPEECPFEHPINWAGFVLIGQ